MLVRVAEDRHLEGELAIDEVAPGVVLPALAASADDVAQDTVHQGALRGTGCLAGGADGRGHRGVVGNTLEVKELHEPEVQVGGEVGRGLAASEGLHDRAQRSPVA